jgi:hypothetical protein
MSSDEEDPALPIKFGPCANDEYAPVPLSAFVREVMRRARDACEVNAQRTGVTRRQFVLSVCGAATALLTLDACTRESHKSTGRRPGGSFQIPLEATTEPTTAEEVLGDSEFVFDVPPSEQF